MKDDVWLALEAQRLERKKARETRLAKADVRGWQELTAYHYRLTLPDGSYIDWWPSANKWALHSTSGVRYYRGALPKKIAVHCEEQARKNIMKEEGTNS